jgi:hypothetical protein
MGKKQAAELERRLPWAVACAYEFELPGDVVSIAGEKSPFSLR